MNGKNRPRFTPEFKAEAVDLVKAADGKITQVARELGISDTSLGNCFSFRSREE